MTNGTVPDFRRDLLFLLIDTARQLRVEIDARARDHGMTRAQWGILIWLERQPGITQKELAEFLEVEPITAARLVDRLEARGMVERRHDERDRRVWRLHLLPPAHAVMRDIDLHRHELTRLLTGAMEPETAEATIAGLQHIKSVLAQDARCAKRGPARDPARTAARGSARDPGQIQPLAAAAPEVP